MKALTEEVLEHYRCPRNQGTLPQAHGSGLAGCLERRQFMRIQVRVEQGRIEAARFQTFGCVSALAAGSYLTEWAVGRTPTEVDQMTAERLDREMGGLAPAKRFCADLAVTALRQALERALQPPEEVL